MKISRHHGVDMQPIRRYLGDLGHPLDPADLIEREQQRLSTLCYLLVDDRLLMLRREKEPFQGHWTAPGGKIEDGEDPLQATIREMHEETNLTIYNPQLKAVCSEVGEPGYNWLLFIFRCSHFRGDIVESEEGELRWLPVDELDRWPLPDIDRHILQYVLDDDPAVRFIRVAYTSDHQVKEFDVRPLEDV